jgi:phosphatidate cytidylyltransferase
VAGRFGDLGVRIASAVVATSVAVTLIYLGGIWTMLLIALAAGAMIWEYRSITLHKGGPCGLDVVFPLIAVVGGVAVAHFYTPAIAMLWLVWTLAGGAIADLRAGERRVIKWALAGGAYIGAAGVGFVSLRGAETHGLEMALWVLLVVAAADIGGYFAGRLIGGPKLWPRVSPKKTWAGSGGGIALAVVTGGLFSWATSGTYALQVCAVSALVAAVSQGGDLVESSVKRHFGVKDSGRLMPGHGGALDRLDALMAAVLVTALVVWWRGQSIFTW